MGKGKVSLKSKIRKEVDKVAGVKKLTKAIKKEGRERERKLEDFDKLKTLLNLEKPELTQAMSESSDSEPEIYRDKPKPGRSGRGRFKQINQKQKRLARLKAFTPQLDPNPKTLIDK